MNNKQQQVRVLTRRNALRILGSAIALPSGILALRKLASSPLPVQWQGEALGAQANLTLWHPNPRFARRTIIRIYSEVKRLEGIFSLYRNDSEISRLNREGYLVVPSRELVEVLELSRQIANTSGGAFDPTIQAIWNVYAEHFSSSHAAHGTPDPKRLAKACKLVNFAEMDVGSRGINFTRKGMLLSLNGIAQGYITDYITDLLRNEGFDNAMVELGETRALGVAPDGQPFIVNLINPIEPGFVNRSILLSNEALSVSGGYGTPFSAIGTHHIFDPITGNSANRLLDAAVIAPSAMIADALSTAIYVAGEQVASKLLSVYPSSYAVVTQLDGAILKI